VGLTVARHARHRRRNGFVPLLAACSDSAAGNLMNSTERGRVQQIDAFELGNIIVGGLFAVLHSTSRSTQRKFLRPRVITRSYDCLV
jgi:hypothetical protein